MLPARFPARLATAAALWLVAACSDPASPIRSDDFTAGSRFEAAKAAPSFSCLIEGTGPYLIRLAWTRAPVKRTWITNALPVRPEGVELVNVYDEHTLARVKRRGTYQVTIADLPTAALFFDESPAELGRTGCVRP